MRWNIGGSGTFDDFLVKLLVRESGIDPARFDWYVREIDSPVMSYPAVTAPGRVVRDHVTGSFTFRPVTIARYFAALGVDHLFDPAQPACIEAMQYASTNILGYIGYQFGETILIDAGYYRPEIVRRANHHGLIGTYPSYYVGSIRDAAWRKGQTEVFHRPAGTRSLVLASDVNRWRGTFTGKNGIRSIEDLKKPGKQRLVIRDVVHLNYRRMKATFKRHRFALRTSGHTWSGLLAAAHLCGSDAAAAFALAGTSAGDQFGTRIRSYAEAFAGFQTPYRDF